MKFTHAVVLLCALAFCTRLAAQPVAEDESGLQTSSGSNLQWDASVGLLDISYGGTSPRTGSQGYKLFLGTKWLDRYGVTVGTTYYDIDYRKQSSSGTEQQHFLSAFHSFNRDGIAGTFTGHIELYQTEQRSKTRISVGGGNFSSVVDERRSNTFALGMHYLPYSRKFLGSVEYARSAHDPEVSGEDKLTVEQFSPAFGFGYNELYDWIQTRLIYAEYSDDPSLDGLDQTLAAQLFWSHWFKPQDNLPDSITAGIQAGETLLSIDSASGSINTLPDIMTGSLSLSATWKFDENSKGYLQAGKQRYETVNGAEQYTGRSIYMNMSYQW